MAILLAEDFAYTLVSRDFYEPLDRYEPRSEDFRDVVKERLPHDWILQRGGMWWHCYPPKSEIPVQGWKIHLSATQADAGPILSEAADILIGSGVAFKFALDRFALRLLNVKNWSRGGAGKFITIYPRSQNEFVKLLDSLHRATIGYKGPYILSDRRYKDSSVIYYRYGGFQPRSRLDVRGYSVAVIQGEDGTDTEDQRNPFFHLPANVTDPVTPADDDREHKHRDAGLKDGRYTVESALSFSNSGGVYLARDQQSGQRVIIKEARPFTNQNPGGDAVTLLKREHRLLRKLRNTGIAPQPIDFFQDWEHYYLVEEYIEGTVLRGYSARWSLLLRPHPTLADAEEFVARYCRCYKKVVNTVRVLHEHGIVFGDLSHYNIIIVGDADDVKLIDFEGAHEPGVDIPTLMYTPGFAPRQQVEQGAAKEDDYYAVGGLMLAGLLPVNGIMALEPHAFEPLLQSAVKDLGFPNKIATCVRQLLSPERHVRPTLDQVDAVLTKRHTVRPPKITGCDYDDHALGRIVDSTLEFIESVIDIEREDRLVPAAPEVFQTNPLCLAYGACGVAYAIHRVRGVVQSSIIDWILSQPLSPAKYAPGLYVGLTGIAWALLEMGYPAEGDRIIRLSLDHPALRDSPDLYNGLAGWGIGQLRFFCATQDDQYLANAIHAGDTIISWRVQEDSRCWWVVDGHEYSGMGHGGTGIALFLLYLAALSGDDKYLDIGTAALDHVVTRGVEMPDGGLTWRVQEGHPTVTPYWRWGSAGIGSTLLRYQTVLGSGWHSDVLSKLMVDTDRKYSIFPAQHLGLAGIGEFYLDLLRFGGCPDAARAGARKILSGVMQFAIKREGRLVFPGESRTRISCDLTTGSAGIAAFIDRLRFSKDAHFMLDSALPNAQITAVGLQCNVAE